MILAAAGFSKLQQFEGAGSRKHRGAPAASTVQKHTFHFQVKHFAVKNVKNCQSGQGSSRTQWQHSFYLEKTWVRAS